MKCDLVRELEAQKTQSPNYVSDLTERAAQEILRLRAQVSRVMSDRRYIIGFNDGYECAEDHGRQASLAGCTGVRPVPSRPTTPPPPKPTR